MPSSSYSVKSRGLSPKTLTVTLKQVSGAMNSTGSASGSRVLPFTNKGICSMLFVASMVFPPLIFARVQKSYQSPAGR